MDLFLRETRKRLTSQQFDCVHAVIGNEACDLDSATSALVYAYYLHKARGKCGTLYIPVLNIRREDYVLRTEVTYALRSHGVPDDLLIFRDQVELFDLCNLCKLRLTLVDFNVQPPADQAMEHCVVEVIDHHQPERSSCDGVDLTIEMVGSCCTLVAEKILKTLKLELSAEDARLLYGTIMLDTICMSDTAGRKTAKDEAIVARLETLLPEVNRTEVFAALQGAKFDVSGLTVVQLLRRDMKTVASSAVKIVISSIPIHLKDFVANPSVETDLEEFSRTQLADAVIVMSLYVDEAQQPHRQLAIFCSNAQIRQQILEWLTASSSPSLQLIQTTWGTSDVIVTFNQNNPQASRENLLPVVQQYLRSCQVFHSGLKTPANSRNSKCDANRTKDSNSIAPPCGSSVLCNISSYSQEGANQNNLTNHNTGCGLSAITTNVNPVRSNNNAFRESRVFRNDSELDFNGGDLDQLYAPSGILLNVSPLGFATPEETSTPPNSFRQSPIERFSRDNDLPSFNSSEMLQKIKRKKASLAQYMDEESTNEADSYTFTPQNSLAESNIAELAFRETNLPSFYSAEMVDKIREKKAALGYYDIEEEMSPDAYPFTPQNSLADGNFDKSVKEMTLPSFHSAEMVEKIKEKRASLNLDPDQATADVGDETDRFPFTPPNSTSDCQFDRFASEQDLPSFYSLEMVQRIIDKRCALGDSNLGDHFLSVKNHPYTPPNSRGDTSPAIEAASTPFDWQIYAESEIMERFRNNRTIGDQTSNFGRFTSAHDRYPSAKSEPENVMAHRIAQEMLRKKMMTKKAIESLYVGKNSQTTADCQSDDYNPAGGRLEQCHAPERSMEFTAHPEVMARHALVSCDSSCIDKTNIFRASADEVAEEVTRELIQNALASQAEQAADEFKASLLNRNAHFNKIVTETQTDSTLTGIDCKKLQQSLQALLSPSQVDESTSSSLEDASMTESLSSKGSLTVETEYLSTVDPLRGNMDFTTDAEKDVAESASFNQMEAEQINNSNAGSSEQTSSDEHTESPLHVGYTDTVNDLIDLSDDFPSSSLPDSDKPNLSRGNEVLLLSMDSLQDVLHLDNDDITEPSTNKHEPAVVMTSSSATYPSDCTLTGPDKQDYFIPVRATRESVDISEVASKLPDVHPPTVGTNDEYVPESDVSVPVSLQVELHSLQMEVTDGKRQAEIALNPNDCDDTTSCKSARQVRFEDSVESPRTGADCHGHAVHPYNSQDDSIEFEIASGIVQEAMESAVHFCETNNEAFVKGAINAKGGMSDGITDLNHSGPQSGTCLSDHTAQNLVPDDAKPEEMINVKEVGFGEEADQSDDEEVKNLRDQIPEELQTAIDQIPKEYHDVLDLEPDPGPDDSPPEDRRACRPSDLQSTGKKKIVPDLRDILHEDEIDIDMSRSSSEVDIGLSLDDEKTPDDLQTPDALNDSVFEGELDWGSESSVTPVEPIPEYTAREEFEESRSWRSVHIGGKKYKIDMKVIEPYKKVLSHGGYYGDGFNAIIVFTACYLPDKRRRDYHYVMDNLFLYVISTLELLVVDDYMIVYFHGATPRHKMPGIRWLKRCYDMIDRRLKKNLKQLLVVHPTLWLRTLVIMTRPFVSSKFSAKLKYAKSLEELTRRVPTEYIFIPEEIKLHDEAIGSIVPKKKFVNH